MALPSLYETRQLEALVTKQEMQAKAMTFMLQMYGAPAQMVDQDCRDRWHECLGLLSIFIDELCTAAEPKASQLHNRPEVMNPPQSAAEGCEARNLTTANVMGLGQVHRATEARPADVAPPPHCETCQCLETQGFV